MNNNDTLANVANYAAYMTGGFPVTDDDLRDLITRSLAANLDRDASASEIADAFAYARPMIATPRR